MVTAISPFKKHIFSILVVGISLFNFSGMTAQTMQENFGQNRVQFHSFDWSYYETDHFNIYFYTGGQDLGKYIIYSSEKNLKEIGESLGVKFRTKINLIVYTDLSDANQTNIGGNDILTSSQSAIRFIENKLFLYFNGNHVDFEKQLREGITRVYLQKFEVQERNDYLFKSGIPIWFKEGLQAYMGERWNTTSDNILKVKMVSGAFKSLKKIQNEDQRLIGHSVWNFIEEQYGKEAVKNIVFYVRRTRNIDNALNYTIGKNTVSVFEEWYDFYRGRYKLELTEHVTLTDSVVKIKNKKDRAYYQFKISPNGQYMAYVQNNMGKYKVILKDIKSNKSKVILSAGFRTMSLITDNNYPMIDFSKNGDVLAIFDERRDQVRLTTYSIKEDKTDQKNIEKFQRIYSFAFTNDKKMVVLSASQKGNSDIFLMNINTQTTTRITNDYYDDLSPCYYNIGETEGIIFSSNRPTDSVYTKPFSGEFAEKFFDLYFYNLQSDENQLLGKVTNTPFANEGNVRALDSNRYSFLSDVSGINNLYRGEMKLEFVYNLIHYTFKDSNDETQYLNIKESVDYMSIKPFNTYTLISKKSEPIYQMIGHNMPLTDYNASIVEMDRSKKDFLFVQNKKNKVVPILVPIDSFLGLNKSLKNSAFRNSIEMKNAIRTTVLDKSVVDTPKPAPIVVPFFQTEFDYLKDTNLFKDNSNAKNTFDRVKAFIIKKNEVLIDTSVSYRFSKTKPYFTKFYIDNLAAQFSNVLLVDRYQKYPSPTPIPQLGWMLKVGIKDLFENYRITAGFRIPGIPYNFSLSSNEVFLSFENVKKRWDKRYSYIRRANTINLSQDSTYKYISNYLDFYFSYPIDYTQRISLNTGFKMDNTVTKVTNIDNISIKNLYENWLYFRPEYVFDNSILKKSNLPVGTKFKAYLEFYKEIPTEPFTITNGFDIPIPQWNQGYFFNWGFDLRKYVSLDKKTIWATRLMYSASVGTRKMLYQIGGIEGEVFASYDNFSIVNPMGNYAFQMYVNNLRGFRQNTRNGNNVAILNTELRIPLFTYIFQNGLKSKFLNNFLLVPFVDIGMAWNGINPYSRENPFYTKPYTNGVTTINANYLKNPMVGSTGVGIRFPLFGHNIKFDMGLPFDSGNIKSLYFNFGLGLDF